MRSWCWVFLMFLCRHTTTIDTTKRIQVYIKKLHGGAHSPDDRIDIGSMTKHSKNCAQQDARTAFCAGASDSWLHKPIVNAYQIFAQRRAKDVMNVVNGPSSQVEELVQTMQNNGTMWRHRPLTLGVCYVLSSLLKHTWPMLEHANTPTTQLNSQASSKHCVSSAQQGRFHVVRKHAFVRF